VSDKKERTGTSGKHVSQIEHQLLHVIIDLVEVLEISLRHLQEPQDTKIDALIEAAVNRGQETVKKIVAERADKKTIAMNSELLDTLQLVLDIAEEAHPVISIRSGEAKEVHRAIAILRAHRILGKHRISVRDN